MDPAEILSFYLFLQILFIVVSVPFLSLDYFLHKKYSNSLCEMTLEKLFKVDFLLVLLLVLFPVSILFLVFCELMVYLKLVDEEQDGGTKRL
jgi:hypothetical protein